MAEATQALLALGLVEPHGQVRVRQAALEFLEAHPTRLGPLALKLARSLDDLSAFPLYARSRSLWAAADEPQACRAFESWAKELLRRGFPQRAFDTLEELDALAQASQTRETLFLKGRALEKAGRFFEAFACVRDLSDTAEVLALKAGLLERLGRSAEARDAAERALHGGVEARSEGQMTLGRLELSRARYEEAAKCFRRAAALYSATNQGTNRSEALNNEAVARSRSGEEAKEAFEELLSLVQDNQALRALALLNLGKEHELREEFGQAVEVYQGAVPLAEEAGALDVAARLWNNLGVCFEAREPGRARAAYQRALELARQTGERRIVGGDARQPRRVGRKL